MLKIDNYAYNSKLLWNAPEAKIAFGAVPLIICLFMGKISTSIFTIIAMGFMTIHYSKVTIRQYLKLMAIPMGFLILGTITIVITSTDKANALFGIGIFGGFYGVTKNSLMVGLGLVLKALGAVSSMYFISLNTVMTDIIGFLNKIKMPSIIVSLMELIYRYIFIIIEEADRMSIAGSSRLGYTNLKTSIKTTGELIASLFVRTYMKCDRIYEALLSRGYDKEFHRIETKYKSSSKLYFIMALIAVTQIIIGVVA